MTTPIEPSSFQPQAAKINHIKQQLVTLVLVCVGIGSYGYLTESIDHRTELQSQVQIVTLSGEWLQSQIESDTANNQLLKTLKVSNTQLLTCINDGLCNGINKKILTNIKTIRSYLLINQLSGAKMEFDQKMLLKNIDNHLLKINNISIGKLSSINFGTPLLVDTTKKIYKLPITIAIDFADQNGFTNFTINVEKKINLTVPVLFKIRSMNYDVTNYDSNQSVTIAMDAYYYR